MMDNEKLVFEEYWMHYFSNHLFAEGKITKQEHLRMKMELNKKYHNTTSTDSPTLIIARTLYQHKKKQRSDNSCRPSLLKGLE